MSMTLGDYILRGARPVIDLLKSDSSEENPCWKGYEMVGTKQKDGKTVPNCVKKTGKSRSFGKAVEHDKATGQFTSGSGKSYKISPTKGVGGGALHDVHDDKDALVGRVSSGAKASKTSSQYHQGKLDGKSAFDEADTPTVHSTTRAKQGAFDPGAHNVARMKVARMLSDAHEKKSGDATEKSITLGDILKAYEVRSVVAPSNAPAMPEGSFEEMLARIRGPVCMGSGCARKPKLKENGERDYDTPRSEGEPYAHYLDVKATFPTHAYVRCSDEDKVWRVPYTLTDDGVVTTGPAEEQVAIFVPADSVSDTDDVSEGAGAL